MIKVGDLRILPWDGVLEEARTNTPAAGQDAVFVHQRSRAWKIQSVTPEGLTLPYNQGTNMPLSQVRRLIFAGPKSEPSVTMGSALHANLVNGVTLTFQLDRWTAEGVDIHSPVFGPARISPGRLFARRLSRAAGGLHQRTEQRPGIFIIDLMSLAFVLPRLLQTAVQWKEIMKCPRCAAILGTTEYDSVEIEVCPDCAGEWLHAGELADDCRAS